MGMDAAEIKQMIASAVAEATAPLHARLAAQDAEIARLKDELARAKKGPHNSSKPGSSDFFKQAERDEPGAGGTDTSAKAQAAPGKKKIGGQPGHKKHTRQDFSEDQITHRKQHAISAEEAERRGWKFVKWVTTYQVELPRDLIVTEHKRAIYFDMKRKRHVRAPFQDPCDAGILSPRMKAMVAWVHSVTHASHESMKQFFEALWDFKLSDGLLAKAIRQVGESLEKADAELIALLPTMLKLHIDETGHKRNGALLWCWIFVAEKFTVIRTGISRKAEVLTRFLGELFAGLIQSDYWGGYRSFKKTALNARFQFCLAHLVRDLRFVAEHPDERAATWGQGMLALFRTMIRARRKSVERKGVVDGELVKTMLVLADNPPDQREAKNIAKRLRDHTESFTLFLEDKTADTTNNRAERGLRPTVLHRKATQGTRSEAGDRTHERLQTVVATCRQQGISAFQFFVDSFCAHRRGTTMPSLVACS